jgi:hypothetical protein
MQRPGRPKRAGTHPKNLPRGAHFFYQPPPVGREFTSFSAETFSLFPVFVIWKKQAILPLTISRFRGRMKM